MASLKEIKSRIGSVKSTQKITSAMRMVASAKLHRAQGKIEAILPYQYKMSRILTDFLISADQTIESPYVDTHRDVKRVAIVVFSSNSSLIGAFNANIIKQLIRTIEGYRSLGTENILIYPVGKKVEEAVLKLGYKPQGSFQQMANKPDYEEASQLAQTLMSLYKEEKIDKAELIFHHFKSVASQELIGSQFLPINLSHVVGDKDGGSKRKPDYIVEPSVREFIANLLPQVLLLKVYTALLDSNASEHAARAMAMQTATDNATNLIKDLTKQYNKSRQQTITNELLDIVGGSMK